MKRIAFIIASCMALVACRKEIPAEVPEEVMQDIYNEIRTPYKYGMVLQGADPDKKTDCPTIVRKGDEWFMYYFVYDGRGYETWLATSRDLLHWENQGPVLSFSEPEDWDCNQKGGYIALPDYKWGGSYKLGKYDGKYWMSYFGSNTTGYEQGDLSIGIAYTSRDPYKPHEWDRLPAPVLTPKDEDVSWWDNNKLYKNSIIRDPKHLTGHEFVMYYNASGPYEAIGMATSDDMVHWKRYGSDPLLDHGKYITGDAYIQKIGDVYVMFYFGCGWNPDKKILAWNSFACSYDLIHWTDWKGEELIKPSEPYDSQFAHKSCVIKWKGVVYHFYCAVDKDDNRGIAVATSKDLSAARDEFHGAGWIAMEPDSTVVYPHIHQLRARSPQGRSLKEYELPVLERRFRLRPGRIVSATANICGLGQYELFVNGEKVGESFLDPGWSMYNRRLLYNSVDVTELIARAKGRKIDLSVMLGGGMYDIPLEGYHKIAGSAGAPKLKLALTVEYAGGRCQTIVSDGSWTARRSPVRFSSIYAGETYDATFNAEPQAVVMTEPRWDVPMERQDDRTRLRIRQELPMTQIAPGLYDSGQNCSGIVRLAVRGKRGSTVTLRPAELVKDGKVNQHCMPGYAWTYTLAGDTDGETWQPQFTYTGFRYVEVSSDDDVEVLGLTALHTTTDVREVGRFECSDTLLNRIYGLIDWAMRSNMASITTDCPTREKLGWQEQNHLMAGSLMYRYDVQALFNKIADDLADSQHPDGAIPTIAPEYTIFDAGSGFEDTPEWGASFILCPYYTYLWYGDDTAIRRHYDAMKRYISYLQGRTEGGILDYGLGDWFDIGPARPGVAQLTSVALSATAMYHYELRVMAEVASFLGKTSDVRRFTAMADDVRKAFNARFWNPALRQYEKGSQTASAMALYMGLVPEGNRKDVLNTLVRDIEKRLAGAGPGDAIVTAGDVGNRYVLQALFEGGRSDLIWAMNRRDDVPGYAYQIKQGATALTESWQAYDNVSNNHLMLGHLMEWIFQGPGGIRQAEGSVGWKHIVIEPQMLGLSWARTTFECPLGPVVCNWTTDSLEVNIPAGADAEVRLADGSVRHVGSGRNIWHFSD